MTKPVKNDDWANRGALAVKAGAMLSVLSVIAVIAAHAPTGAEDRGATAPVAASSAPADAKPYYFPSQYELNAAEPGEPAPTF